MSVTDKLKGKRILIWGYGREGQSTRLFLKRCCEPAVIDVFEGAREDIDEEAYDYIIKSPGIPMEDDNPKYTSQTELFLEEHSKRVIGITGTKGKSTTSSMIYHVLKETYPGKVILLGNIGEPCLNYFDEVDDNTIVVFEMSCHQLAHLSVSPHIAVFLNLYEEHLDYYKTFDRYFAAKRNISNYQTEEDFFIVGEQVPEFETKAQKIVMGRDNVPNYVLKVLGEHNKYNADVAVKIASELIGVSKEAAIEALKTFEGLAHRLQYIGTLDGVSYYDDSISTIPGATIQALESVPGAKTVLVGGMDRGIDYEELITYIRAHHEYNYICSYDSGKRIYDEVADLDCCSYRENLEQAVAYAKEITPSGMACILSPASASYGYFKNFEQRGEIFKELVGV